MPESIMSKGGRLTVPAEIRKAVKATPGTRFVWVLMRDGNIELLAKTAKLSDSVGMLKPAKGIHVSIEDMNPFR